MNLRSSVLHFFHGPEKSKFSMVQDSDPDNYQEEFGDCNVNLFPDLIHLMSHVSNLTSKG